MPSSSTSVNKLGRKIVFEEDTHKYYIDDSSRGRIHFTSVTTFIGNFFPKFDADRIAPFVAKKRGITVQEVLDEWDRNRQESCDFGTRVHACCEDTINGRELRYIPTNEKEERTYANAVRAANTIIEQFDIIGAEQLIFDEKLKLSGTIDLLAKSKTAENTYCIIDWKTNKEIRSFSKYNEFAFKPIQDLPDCEKSHYGLQLTLYGHILKSGLYIPDDAKLLYLLVHVTPDGNNYIPIVGYEKYVDLMLGTIEV